MNTSRRAMTKSADADTNASASAKANANADADSNANANANAKAKTNANANADTNVKATANASAEWPTNMNRDARANGDNDKDNANANVVNVIPNASTARATRMREVERSSARSIGSGVLHPSERRTLMAAAEVLLLGIEFEISLEEVADNVELFIGRSQRAWRVRALLILLEHLPLTASMPRFSRASRAEREEFLRTKIMSAETAPWSLCRRIRPLVLLGAYASPSARRHVGWVEIPNRKRFLRIVRAA